VTTLALRVLGRPAPQGSHEIGANGRITHSSNYLAAWRRQVEIAAYAAMRDAGLPPRSVPYPVGVPVYVHELTLIVGDEQCRAAGTDEPIGRPDVDKLLRATIDGLGDAHVFADDAQIKRLHEIAKERPWDDEQPGAIIIISDRPRPVITQGESMTNSSKRYELALVEIDVDGERTDLAVVTGSRATVVAMLPHVAAELGAQSASVIDSSAGREQQAELADPAAATAAPADGEPKRGRGRPRKTAAAPAEPAAAEPTAAAVGETTEGAAVPEQAAQAPAAPVPAPVEQVAAPAEPVAPAAEPLPAAPAGRVNPFATS
jgi:Holliday junction resolvase RusA-like endonuclease